ncbi:acetyl-CoA acetyltransferase [Polymorphobacter multimanifer]|uniref:acetyl-CoA acetyltransferase n=1 Tax=Polymorphobacter multimanifer TaxID=1070431 RepID=UPI001FB14B90|nr:acetyl-CoA acetyltransferase [Polymorphobacter multimanifer]
MIIGVGEMIDRPADPAAALEPLALMAAAVRAADDDAGGGFLARIDSLDVINLVSWRYDRVAARLAERLGITPMRAVYGVVGGETPTTKIHEAAIRIMNGDSIVAVVTGGEATNAVAKAKAAGVALDWTPPAAQPENPIVASDHVTPLAMRHGIVQPAHIYPFYDHAAAAAWGMTPGDALAEAGAIWAAFSQVAAQNPGSWGRSAFNAEQITTATPDNRYIAWPYTKRMVANPAVNQAGAVLLTTLAVARAAGIPEHRMVFVHGGAGAAEPVDYLARDQFGHSVAQDAVLDAAMAVAPGGFGAVELYSCFPIVPKMARRSLGLAADAAMTVCGGLSFFGAPLNTYMTHATCAMVRHLRATPAAHALLYGQGGYVTKHHALVLGSGVPEPDTLMRPRDVQMEAEAMRSPVPPLALDHEGAAEVETFTVVHDREGAPAYGSIIGLTPAGKRVFARIDIAEVGALERLDASPVGAAGTVTVAEDGLQHWRF